MPAFAADVFRETFGVARDRTTSPYVPQSAGGGQTSYFQFADTAGSTDSVRINDGYYAVINPDRVLATGGFSFWTDHADHTGDGGAVLTVNAGGVQNQIYRRVATLTTGQSYRFSAWRYVINSPTSIQFEVREPDDSASLAASSAYTTVRGDGAAGRWVQMSYVFQAGQNCVSPTMQVAVALTNTLTITGGNDYQFDDIVLEDTSDAPAAVLPCVSKAVATVTATDDRVTTPLDTPISIDVRRNDSTSDPAVPLGLPVVQGAPANGAATVDANGLVVYTPITGFSGTDTFRYQVCSIVSLANPTAVCRVATVTVFVGAPVSVPADAPWALGLGALAILGTAFGLRRKMH